MISLKEAERVACEQLLRQMAEGEPRRKKMAGSDHFRLNPFAPFSSAPEFRPPS